MDTIHVPSEESAVAGCAAYLDDQAAGCVPASSEPGDVAMPAPANEDSAGAPSEAPAEAASEPIRPATVREFERAMRRLGFTRREAEVIRCRGFDALVPEGAPDDQAGTKQLEELAAALRRRHAALMKE